MELDASEMADLRKLIKALGKFNAISSQMQVSTILTILQIAEYEASRKDWQLSDLEKAIGLLSGTSSRNVYYWASGARGVTKAMDYIRIGFDPVDRRRRAINFTAQGKAFIDKVLSTFKKG